MSHVTKIKIDILSLTALQRSVEALGLQMKEKTTYKWFGQHVGDYPLPDGFTVDRLGKCDYAISVPGKLDAYEVGVVKMPSGAYTLLWDFWNGGYGLETAIGQNGERLITEYTLQAAVEAAESQGWYVERNAEQAIIHHPDGGIITVDASGAVDASQFTGGSCIAACSPIENALGSQTERNLKPEYYQQKQSILQGE